VIDQSAYLETETRSCRAVPAEIAFPEGFPGPGVQSGPIMLAPPKRPARPTHSKESTRMYIQGFPRGRWPAAREIISWPPTPFSTRK